MVSWKDAADNHDSVASDALVIPMSSGRPDAGAPPSATMRRFSVSKRARSTNSPGNISAVTGLDDRDATKHLSDDDLDVLVVNLHTLTAVDLLDLRGEVLLHLARAKMRSTVFGSIIGGNAREAVNEGRADYVPVFLSDIPSCSPAGILPLDVVLINVSPPDAHGYCSLGTSVDAALCGRSQSAEPVIAQINPSMPRTLGDSLRPRRRDRLRGRGRPAPA